MPTIDIERLRDEVSREDRFNPIIEHLVSAHTSTTHLSVRGIYQALLRKGTRTRRDTAEKFISTLASCGAGKLVKKGGVPDKLVDMPLSTRELGESVMGQVRDVKKYRASQDERGIERTAKGVTEAPQTFKVYPMRRASSISITLTINGKEVVMPLPDNLSSDMLQTLIDRLKRVEDGYDPRKK